MRIQRYGRETEELVHQALAREHWDREQWQAWQSEKLSRVLQRAATRVPYYRSYWNTRRRAGDRSPWLELGNWPILEKETVRENPRAFVADDCNPRRMYTEYTSGSTGKPMALFQSLPALRQWYALFEARRRYWYGVSRRDRWANVGGQLITPVHQRRPPFWVWNAAMRQLYMSSFHLSPDLISHYLHALDKYRVKYLFGYTSSLAAIAREVLERGWHCDHISVVITNAEPLPARERAIIEKGFACDVRETYGMSENAAAASECRTGRLHLWPEAGVVEVVEDGEPAADGMAGDLVCTGLLNEDMPLIRYRVGDRGALSVDAAVCGCGRTLPVLSSVEGRIDDVLYTRDGRRIGRLDSVFKTDFPIREAQIIQRSLDSVCVKVVPGKDYDDGVGRDIVERLRLRIGDIDVDLQRVDEIPRGPNGKMRAVVSELPATLRETFR